MTSLRSGLRPPKRTRFSTSCVENRFSPVESGGRVDAGDLGEQREVERIARLLEPAQAERRKPARISKRVGAIEFRIGVDRELRARRQDRFDRLDAGEIVGERHAADLHLHHGVAGVEMAAHLVLQILGGLARRIPAAADIAEHFVGDLAAVEALGQHAVQRLVGDLGDGVPDRDLDGADADRALGMPAGLFVLHHDGEDFFRREIAGVIEQRVGRRFEDARNKPRAHLRAAGIAAGGIEGEAAHRLAGALDVGDHGDHRRRHLAEIEARIGERRVERDRRLADIDDAHRVMPSGASLLDLRDLGVL